MRGNAATRSTNFLAASPTRPRAAGAAADAADGTDDATTAGHDQSGRGNARAVHERDATATWCTANNGEQRHQYPENYRARRRNAAAHLDWHQDDPWAAAEVFEWEVSFVCPGDIQNLRPLVSRLSNRQGAYFHLFQRGKGGAKTLAVKAPTPLAAPPPALTAHHPKRASPPTVVLGIQITRK